MRDFVRRSRRRLIGLLLVGIALIGFGILAAFWMPLQRTEKLQLTGGVTGLNRDAIAQFLRRHTVDQDLVVEIVPTEGTLESLRLIESQKLDMAIVNSLVRHKQADAVRQVAAITVEALHVLVKAEYAEQVMTDFAVLNELSINMGPAESETEMISRAVLSFCGIQVEPEKGGTVVVDRKSINELLQGLGDLVDANGSAWEEARASLPDVVIHSSTLPSPLAQQLIENGDYRLIPMPFAGAFSKISVEEAEWDRDHVDEVHVVATEIPAYMYGVTPAIPSDDLPTLGCPLVLVAHQDVPKSVVARLLPRLFDGPVYNLYRSPPLRDVTPAYPWHAASLDYRDREKPLLRSDLLSLLQLLISVIAPLIGGCLALYGFYRWRQTLRFLEYFQQLLTLDMEAKGLMKDDFVSPAEAKHALRIEAELTHLQQRAVTDFCRNYFHGEGVLENFLQLLGETRAFLRNSVSQSLLEDARHPRVPANQSVADGPAAAPPAATMPAVTEGSPPIGN